MHTGVRRGTLNRIVDGPQPCEDCGGPGQICKHQKGKHGVIRIYHYAKCNPCYKRGLKRLVLVHYGNGNAACIRCGFDNIDGLCLDHINDDGGEQRRAISGTNAGFGGGFYSWLHARGLPAGLQTLCYNCNMIKQVAKKRRDRLAKYGIMEAID